ncbi:unnamed protein product [Prunus brigantina]
MDDQSDLMRQLLHQISLAQNLGLGQPGEERRMDKRTGGQLNGYQASRARVSRQGEGQQQSVLQRLGPQGSQQDNHRNEDRGERRSAVHSQRSIHERLGPHGGQSDNPHNEDH